MKNYLSFENEIKNIEAEIDKLKDPYNNEGISTVDTGRIDKLQSDLDKKLKDKDHHQGNFHLPSSAHLQKNDIFHNYKSDTAFLYTF